jgi:hypothetical protein
MAHYFRRKLAHLSETELEMRIEETLKFLVIAPLCSGSVPVTQEIDEIWHYWILQTQEYDSLCSSMPTPGFIHHSSNAFIEYFDEKAAPYSNLLSDVRMLAAYLENYGPFEESRVKYWKLASDLCEGHGWSVDQLNDWLGSNRSTQVAMSA